MRVSTTDITRKGKARGTNDIFEKCRNFTRPNDLKDAGLYMYFEVFGDVRVAIAREKQIKGWLRKKKIALLKSVNRDWNDLSDGWYGGGRQTA